MRNHIWTRFIHMIALCVSVQCLPPITKELTAVTNTPELDNIFLKFHSDDLPKSKQKAGELEEVGSSSTVDSDSPETTALNKHDSSSENTSTLTASASHDAPAGTSQHNELLLTGAIKEEICGHISSSGFFIMNRMFPYSPTEHVGSMYKNNPILAHHFFKMRMLDKENDGAGRHLLPHPTLVNPSQGHRIYVEGHRKPFIEKMFSCVIIEGVLSGTVRRYYVTDREYNFSKDPHTFIAGRFLAMRDPDDKKLKLMAMAEQAATLEAIDLKRGAALFASLKDKHTHPQMKYSISRLSPGETIRLCTSVMSAIRRDFLKDLIFLPTLGKISKYQPQPIRALKVRGSEEDNESLHLDTGGSMAAVVCRGKDDETYHVVQGDEQDAVFVANEMTYQTEVVRYFASKIAILTEAPALPALEKSPE